MRNVRCHYIYAFTDPRNNIDRYIGQGQVQQKRQQRRDWWKFVRQDDPQQYGVIPWIKELRAEKREPIVTIILDNLTQKEVDAWEKGLIETLGRADMNTGRLLNRAAGGLGGGHSFSGESRRKISEANKGTKPSAYCLRRVKEANTGREFSEDTRRKLTQARMGNTNRNGAKHSEKTRQKMSAAQTARRALERQKQQVKESVA